MGILAARVDAIPVSVFASFAAEFGVRVFMVDRIATLGPLTSSALFDFAHGILAIASKPAHMTAQPTAKKHGAAMILAMRVSVIGFDPVQC